MLNKSSCSQSLYVGQVHASVRVLCKHGTVTTAMCSKRVQRYKSGKPKPQTINTLQVKSSHERSISAGPSSRHWGSASCATCCSLPALFTRCLFTGANPVHLHHRERHRGLSQYGSAIISRRPNSITTNCSQRTSWPARSSRAPRCESPTARQPQAAPS